MKSYCSNCNRPTNQNVLKEEQTSYDDGTGWWEETKYQIIRCCGCDEITYRTVQNNAQIYSQYEGEEAYVQDLYPKRGHHSIPINKFHNLPFNVNEIYHETIEAFNNEQIILCSAGLRAIIEAICIDKSVKGILKKNKKGIDYLQDSLEGKIDGLAENGFLTSENSKILHELRFIGNDALHELSKPSVKELKLAIDIIEISIESIYEVEFKAQNLRRQKKIRKT